MLQLKTPLSDYLIEYFLLIRSQPKRVHTCGKSSLGMTVEFSASFYKVISEYWITSSLGEISLIVLRIECIACLLASAFEDMNLLVYRWKCYKATCRKHLEVEVPAKDILINEVREEGLFVNARAKWGKTCMCACMNEKWGSKREKKEVLHCLRETRWHDF